MSNPTQPPPYEGYQGQGYQTNWGQPPPAPSQNPNYGAGYGGSDKQPLLGMPVGQPGYTTVPGQTTTIIHQPAPSVVVVGGCPACRVGVLEDDFTCCGVCCAIVFFPIGILCCLAMRQRRCPNCGAIFG